MVILYVEGTELAHLFKGAKVTKVKNKLKK